MERFFQILRIARSTRTPLNPASFVSCSARTNLKPRLPDSVPWPSLSPLARASLTSRPKISTHDTCSLQNVRSFASEAVTRNANFSAVTESDVAFFRSVLGETGVVQDVDALESANQDWIGKYKGCSKILLRPESTAQVSQLLTHCNERQLAVVPQGGNTGLVGGSVPVFDEIILSTSRMNKILSFDDVSGIVVAESGCVLETLGNFLEGRGYVMPLDLGAKGSCQLGGNVSTNAGGLRLLRYGSLHGNVLGVEVVLANGSVVDLLGTLRKDNTGYDLKQLFIGGEGTLGIVTKVSLLAPPSSPSVHVAFCACTDYTAVKSALVSARQELGQILSAFEFMDREALEMALTHLDGVRDPLPACHSPFYLLVETSGSHSGHDREKLELFLEGAMERGVILDGTIARDETQAKGIWRLREGVTESLQKAGAVYKYDLSIPVADLYSLVVVMRERMAGLATVVAYGHLGDGNLHLNISAPKYDQKILDLIEPFVYEWTADRRGSISAEHGVGLMKTGALHYSKKPEAIELMTQVKALFDPKGILNPYKVLPQKPALA